MVSVTTYRDAGFLPQAFVNFLCLLGWSPKDDRENMSRQELIDAFSLEGMNRSNATVNFTEEDPFDPKAVWLNAEHIRTLPVEELAAQLLPFVAAAGLRCDAAKMLADHAADPGAHQAAARRRHRRRFLLRRRTAALRPRRTDPAEGRRGHGRRARWSERREVLATSPSSRTTAWMRRCAPAPSALKIKAGQMFQPIRVAVCGRKNAPPLFETLEVLGRETLPETHRPGH